MVFDTAGHHHLCSGNCDSFCTAATGEFKRSVRYTLSLCDCAVTVGWLQSIQTTLSLGSIYSLSVYSSNRTQECIETLQIYLQANRANWIPINRWDNKYLPPPTRFQRGRRVQRSFHTSDLAMRTSRRTFCTQLLHAWYTAKHIVFSCDIYTKLEHPIFNMI